MFARMISKNLESQIAEHAIQYKESYYRLAYSYVRNQQDALDIVQESVCKAIIASGTLKTAAYIRTWFYRIVVNTSLDFLRKHKRMVVVDEDGLALLDDGRTDSYSDIDLQHAIENLPDKYRVLIVLRYFEDLKIDEIALVLDENVNTVKTKLYKALKLLRIDMEDEQEEQYE